MLRMLLSRSHKLLEGSVLDFLYLHLYNTHMQKEGTFCTFEEKTRMQEPLVLTYGAVDKLVLTLHSLGDELHTLAGKTESHTPSGEQSLSRRDSRLLLNRIRVAAELLDALAGAPEPEEEEETPVGSPPLDFQYN